MTQTSAAMGEQNWLKETGLTWGAAGAMHMCTHQSEGSHVCTLLGSSQGPLCVPGYGHKAWPPCTMFLSVSMPLPPDTPPCFDGV